MKVKPDWNGWRDEWISNRHRAWGFNCPAVDLDFVMCEYHYGMPVALVEYKHMNAKAVDRSQPTYRALIALADGYRHRELPAFVARYESDNATFIIEPLNLHAKRHFGNVAGSRMCEQDFVRHLYLLRKSSLTASDEALINSLSTTTGMESSDLGGTLTA